MSNHSSQIRKIDIPLISADTEVAEIIALEARRQEFELELIASENYTSRAVMEANASVLTNKYSEGYPGKRYYAGQEFIDRMENLAIDRVKEIFGAEYANVQPLSGSWANLAVYLALLSPGDTVLGMSLNHGGHLSHGHPLNFSGLLYNIVSYGVEENGRINMEEVATIARQTKPKMIIAGFSAYSRDLDWKRFREIADEVGAYLLADISHIAGLIAGGILENPVPYCDVVTTTTHKTLRGPRGAVILAKESVSKNIARAVFPGVQGGPHEHTIAAKAVAFWEVLTPEFKEYAKQVVINAKALAEALISLGYTIISGGTDNHLLLVDMVKSRNCSGKEAEVALEKVGISVNKNMIPFDTRKPLDPSGIRIGTPAATTRGMKEEDMRFIAGAIDRAILSRDNEEILASLKEEVREYLHNFPLYT